MATKLATEPSIKQRLGHHIPHAAASVWGLDITFKGEGGGNGTGPTDQSGARRLSSSPLGRPPLSNKRFATAGVET